MPKAIQTRRGTTAQHASFTGLVGEVTIDTDKKTAVVHDGVTAGGTELATHMAYSSQFWKANPLAVSFTKTGNGSATLSFAIKVEINFKLFQFASGTSVFMPTLTAGTDYAIYACNDGTVRADASFTAPAGYTTTTSRQIGGFHYAPGGNATAQSGGNTTPQINEYSFWDLKWRFRGGDNRGMTLCGSGINSGIWTDIYLTNTNYITNGTSKYNVTIADGSSPPLISPLQGGTGSNSYGSYTHWEAGEVASWAGKKLPTYREFCLLAYGTTENSSIGSDQGTTQWNAAYVSKWGVNQVSGVMWQWGADYGGGAQAAGWLNNNGGRGQTYQLPNAAIFGGNWNETSNSGSRASNWNNAPSNSNNNIGSRCVGDENSDIL